MIRQKNPHRGAVGIGLSDGIAVFVGAHSLQLFEGSGEMGGVRIAHHFSDFADFQFGVGEELLDLLNWYSESPSVFYSNSSFVSASKPNMFQNSPFSLSPMKYPP